MSKFTRTLGILAATIVATLWIAPAQAQATRTWVSGVGSDANPCSLTAPCKTFAGAISKTAAGGEIDALDPGGYGAVTINKALTIDGGGGQVASVLASGGNGIVVQAAAADVVVLRNIRIQGIRQTVSPGTNGVRFLTGAELNIENCNIDGFSVYAVSFEPSATSKLSISNSIFANNGSAATGGGVLDKPTTVTGTSFVTIANTVITGGGIGVQVNGAGGGSPNFITIADSVITQNVLQGILATTASSGIKMVLDGVKSTNNGTSGTGEGLRVVGGAASVYFGRSTFTGNVSPGVVSATGGLLFSYGDNQNDLNGGAGSSAATPAPHY